MATPDPVFRPLSGVTLGLGLTSDTTDTLAPPTVRPVERYADGGLLGRGGMGEVRAVHDAELDRVVARKRPLRAGSVARLLAEARITARLTHPGIPPVLDVGHDPDGSVWYTMPVVEGRSLAERAAGASLAERLLLVRHVLDACYAVAYAHSREVLHRDLKPENVMVGAFGETVVMDWGLAAPPGEPALASDGSILGTPGYMAPEQAAGRPLDGRADVYALGATLHALLHGHPPPQPTARGAEAPPALVAIASRALHTYPDERYATALELAADLAAWFEGRRVGAYTYSLGELLHRSWIAWRPWWIAGFSSLLVVAGVALAAWQRTARERDRAVLAEQQAVEARSASDRNLALSHAMAAINAWERDDRAEAEVLAATALTGVDSPEARGVLMGFNPATRPIRVGRVAQARCDQHRIRADGAAVLCLREDGTVTQTEVDGRSPPQVFELPNVYDAWTGADPTRLLALDRNGQVWMFHDGHRTLLQSETNGGLRFGQSDHPGYAVWRRRRAVVVADLKTGALTEPPGCELDGLGNTAGAALDRDGILWVACDAGAVLRGPPSGPLSVALRYEGRGLLDQVSPSGTDRDRVAIHTVAGTVAVFDLASPQPLFETNVGATSTFGVRLADRRLACFTGRNGVIVQDIETGATIAALPSQATLPALHADGVHVTTWSSGTETWLIPAGAEAPQVWRGSEGVSAIAVSPDGRRLASTHGDGSLRIVRLDRDQTEIERTFAGGVLKDVAFSPDGGALVVQPTSGPPSIVELTPPWSTHALPGGLPARRVAWSSAGILTSNYGGGLMAWSNAVDTAPRRLHPDTDFRDVLPWREAGRTLAFTGDLHAFDLDLSRQGDSALRPAPAYDGFVSVAASARFVGTKGTHITTIDHDGARATFALDGYQPITVAISPDGRWIATGTVDGSVFVFDAADARRAAVLRGHTRQTVALAFSPDGTALFSGSWDHTVRRWSIWPLITSPESARAEVVQAWGRSADDIVAQASDAR